MAGFVAATYCRGVPYAQVPTTLLAMLDASVGGKVGVDTPQGKNLIGAFHPPAIVVSDPAALMDLPAAEYRAGFAEAIKHGVIADAAISIGSRPMPPDSSRGPRRPWWT
jgi:3-dehydroquinate synthetase